MGERRQGSYHSEYAASRPISEAKQSRARLVVGWVTACEHRVSLLFCPLPSTRIYHCYITYTAIYFMSNRYVYIFRMCIALRASAPYRISNEFDLVYTCIHILYTCMHTFTRYPSVPSIISISSISNSYHIHICSGSEKNRFVDDGGDGDRARRGEAAPYLLEPA